MTEPIDVEALRALLEKASLSPWAQHENAQGVTVITAPDGDEGAWEVAHICDECGWEEDHADANAALIVALRNNAETLLSAEQRAQKAEGELREYKEAHDYWQSLTQTAEAERDALAADAVKALTEKVIAEHERDNLQAQLTASQGRVGKINAFLSELAAGVFVAAPLTAKVRAEALLTSTREG